ncbi:MAG: hypothetical protein ACFFA3_05820 [Promethearchaeota archaeon]
MEKPKILNGTKIEPYKNKEKFADKLDSLWNKDSSQECKLKNQNKKLIIKLHSIGKETRKISLKLESSNSNLNQNNYNLLSDLLKEFFDVDNNSL